MLHVYILAKIVLNVCCVSLVCHIYSSAFVIDTWNLSFFQGFAMRSICCVYIIILCKMYSHIILLGLATPCGFLFTVYIISHVAHMKEI